MTDKISKYKDQYQTVRPNNISPHTLKYMDDTKPEHGRR